MKYFILCTLLVSQLFGLEIRVFSSFTREFMDLEKFSREAHIYEHIVFGEDHYSEKGSLAIREIMEKITSQRAIYFNFAWEFVNYTDQEKLQKLVDDYKAGTINKDEFILGLFPNEDFLDQNKKYWPILEYVLNQSAKFYGLNAPRSVKRKIIENGLSYLEEQDLPPNMEMGGEQYFERFEEAMSGHLDSDKLQRYFEAQCFTDSMMAYQYSVIPQRAINFSLVGNFHSNFRDGYLKELERYTHSRAANIRVVSEEYYSEEEIQAKLNYGKYGWEGDYIILVK